MAIAHFQPELALEVLLSAVMAAHGEATLRVDAVFQLVLAGGPEMVLSVDCTCVPAEIRRGPHDGAELTLVLHRDRLLPLLSGELDVERACDTGELEVTGDPEVLSRLATLWSTRRGTDALSLMIERRREEAL
ncbi:MAG: SCP2 sterol-binding domain-containing protein [Deltaproteobacteria bacterium]|nr:SCP2 sterol-binding domain-containing protein [Deltaproteobacteria bacterium]